MMFLVQVVNTSQLIKDDFDLLNNQKVACFLEDEHLTSTITNSPSKNVLTRVFNEKTWLREDMKKEREMLKSGRCMLSRNPSISALLDSDVYFIGERSLANYLLANPIFFKSLFKKLWVNERAIAEYPLVVYHTRDKRISGE